MSRGSSAMGPLLSFFFGNNIAVVQASVLSLLFPSASDLKILNAVKNLANVSWKKELLGEAEASFVATDAIIPRRPSARSFRRYALSG